jgi:hypothetical protein
MLVTAELRGEPFEELLAELVARVPVQTPGWTEGNDSDPGITILHLFEFLAESLLARGGDPRLRQVLHPQPHASIRLTAVEPDRMLLRICRRRFRVLSRCDELELVRYGEDEATS